jgi:biuret amidohydrolase
MQLDTLVVVGIATNCCVSTTIRDAADLGYGVAVVEQCTGDYDAATHDTAIRGLFFNFARFCPNVTQLLDAIDEKEAI